MDAVLLFLSTTTARCVDVPLHDRCTPAPSSLSLQRLGRAYAEFGMHANHDAQRNPSDVEQDSVSLSVLSRYSEILLLVSCNVDDRSWYGQVHRSLCWYMPCE